MWPINPEPAQQVRGLQAEGGGCSPTPTSSRTTTAAEAGAPPTITATVKGGSMTARVCACVRQVDGFVRFLSHKDVMGGNKIGAVVKDEECFATDEVGTSSARVARLDSLIRVG